MADTKISALTSATSLVGDELFPIVVTPSGTPANRKATAQLLANYIASQAAAGAEALDMLAGRQGFAVNFLARSAAIRHWNDPTKNFIGTPETIMPIARSTTATYFNSSGVLETAAINGYRYDYTPNTLAARGLLIEPSATNLELHSEDFSQAVHAKTNVTITQDAATAPNGTLTADTIVETVANGSHLSRQSITFDATTQYTASCFVKAAGRTDCVFLCNDGALIRSGIIDLNAGTITAGSTSMSGTQTIQNCGNGWFRVSVTFTTGATISSSYVDLRLSDGAPMGTGDVYTGDGTSGVHTWGWQVELGSVATAYIPTTSATVTRGGDNLAILTSLLPYTATAGTLFVEFELPSPINPSGDSFARLSASSTDIIRLGLQANTPAARAIVINEGATQAAITSATLTAGTHKAAMSWANNSTRLSTNGAAGTEATTVTLPTAATEFALCGAGHGNTVSSQRWLRKVMYLPQQLSQSDLDTLTT